MQSSPRCGAERQSNGEANAPGLRPTCRPFLIRFMASDSFIAFCLRSLPAGLDARGAGRIQGFAWLVIGWATGLGLASLIAPPVRAADDSWILPAPAARWLSPQFRQLDARRADAARELGALHDLVAVEQSQRLGWRMLSYEAGPWRTPVWVQVDLGREVEFDAIALVPAHVTLPDFAGPGFGFPVRFRVEVVAPGAAPRVLADFTTEDFPNPGVLPVWLPTPGSRGRSIRITMTQPWVLHPGFRGFALAEMLVLRGGRNLATGLRGVTVRTSHSQETTHAWTRANLIDGQSPVGAPLGKPLPEGIVLGHCWHSETSTDALASKWVQVDLGVPQSIDEVRLVPARMLHQNRHDGYGFPVRFRVEVDDEPEFTRPRRLADYTGKPVVNPGFNPVTIPGDVKARYVRVTATELYRRNWGNHAFALAELQVYSGDRNLAAGAPVLYLDNSGSDIGRHPRFLTDGTRWEQRLGEWPDWLRGLSRRRELLAQLDALEAKIVPLQRTLTQTAGWVATTLAIAGTLAVIAAFYRLKLRRVREADALRRRIASDLHDDLGSNLASIALLSEICLEARGSAPRADLEEIRTLARDTAESLRDVTWLIQPGPRTSGQFSERLRATARRLLAGHEWTFEIEGGGGTLALDLERHLLLALKEILHNVVRHAAAAHVRIQLSVTGDRFRLEVADDGCGFDPATVAAGQGLASLRHRARMLGGEAGFVAVPGQGTTVVFTGRFGRKSRAEASEP